MGIQPEAVKLKMAREGFDPNILDLDPNGPSPFQEESVASGSDDDRSSEDFDD